MPRKRVKVRKGDRVRVHYTCRLADGSLAYSSVGADPIEFTLGKADAIIGLEEAVATMKVGESRTVSIPPEKAYGQRREEWALSVPRDKMPEGFIPIEGLRFELEREGGHSSAATITHISESSVTLDFNHPLAGRELTCEISLLEIVG
ncbi:MAG TPA: peptidylprolyl isomerase [Thermodesulfovibrionales bacterium]|nr:peptidylprolyl isomerase [Thermodesulfovibrionales bacterium]